MKARFILAVCAAIAAGAVAVQAGDLEATVVQQLRKQGFTDISVSHTWLGRTRIRAASSGFKREIVFNTRSGEILRDYVEAVDGDSGSGTPGLLDLEDDGDDSGASAPGGSGDAEPGDSGDGGDAGSGGGDGGDAGSGGGDGGGSGGGGEHASLGIEYLLGGNGGDIRFT